MKEKNVPHLIRKQPRVPPNNNVNEDCSGKSADLELIGSGTENVSLDDTPTLVEECTN